jgi:pimeloyl-ACP methyl ester carboxylesterase
MEIISEKVVDGVTETRFDLAAEGETVPGKRWGPEGVAGGRPTILMGHGGFQSKEAPNIVEMAADLARQRGYVTYALDAPGHGERRTEEQIRQQEETLRQLRSGGTGGRTRDAARPSAAADAAPEGEVRLPRMVREWKVLLDKLDKAETPPSSYGYWGVSMGARNGIPLAASDARIKAAVFGLFAYLPDPVFRQQVKSIEIPLLFLFQYNDELMTPEAGLALWKNFGSKEKTMHINPGPHVGIPIFERDSSSAFFARHLD